VDRRGVLIRLGGMVRRNVSFGAILVLRMPNLIGYFCWRCHGVYSLHYYYNMWLFGRVDAGHYPNTTYHLVSYRCNKC